MALPSDARGNGAELSLACSTGMIHPRDRSAVRRRTNDPKQRSSGSTTCVYPARSRPVTQATRMFVPTAQCSTATAVVHMAPWAEWEPATCSCARYLPMRQSRCSGGKARRFRSVLDPLRRSSMAPAQGATLLSSAHGCLSALLQAFYGHPPKRGVPHLSVWYTMFCVVRRHASGARRRVHMLPTVPPWLLNPYLFGSGDPHTRSGRVYIDGARHVPLSQR